MAHRRPLFLHRRIGRSCGWLAILLATIGPSQADILYRSENGSTIGYRIESGARVLLSADSDGGRVELGGRSIHVADGHSIAGATTDHHYLAVISGEARLGELIARRGEVLLLQPWGAAPSTAIFEAASLAGFAKGIDRGLDKALSSLIRSQNLKLFFGRYTRTAFDLQQPGGAEHEQQRSRAAGDEVISAIRYSGGTDQLEIEGQVVARFVKAMNRGDAEAAAVLLAPGRYGGEAMDSLGARARVATASILARNWREVDSGTMSRTADRVWEGAGVRLELIITSDFIYVSTVSTD